MPSFVSTPTSTRFFTRSAASFVLTAVVILVSSSFSPILRSAAWAGPPTTARTMSSATNAHSSRFIVIPPCSAAQRMPCQRGCLPRRPLADDATAHHANGVAGHVGRRLGGEEHARVRDVLRAAEPPQRDLLDLRGIAGRRLLEFRIPLGVAALRVDEAGHHHVGADAEGAQLRRQRADEAEQSGLRRGHGRRVGPSGDGRLPAELGEPPPDHRLDGRRVADVRERGDDARSRLAALVGHGLQLVAVDTRVEHEVRALGGERQRDRTADVAAGAGDQRGLALEAHSALHHRFLPLQRPNGVSVYTRTEPHTPEGHTMEPFERSSTGFGPGSAVAAERVTAFLRAVYGWMCAGLAITAVVAYMVAGSPALLQVLIGNQLLLFGLFIGQLALVFVLSARVDRLAPGTAAAIFVGYAALTGVTLSVLVLAYTGASIATTFVVTAGMFGALAFYGTTTARSLAGAGQFFFMGLIGLVLASVVSVFWHNDALQFLISVVGVIVFTGLTAYDAQRLKQMALTLPQGQTRSYAIVGALSLYLDFLNLFLFLLRLLGDRPN